MNASFIALTGARAETWLGQHLARAELRIGFSALLRHFPDLRLAVAPEDVPLRAGRGIYGVDRLPVAW